MRAPEERHLFFPKSKQEALAEMPLRPFFNSPDCRFPCFSRKKNPPQGDWASCFSEAGFFLLSISYLIIKRAATKKGMDCIL